MIAHSYIKKNLGHLDRRYRHATSIMEANYCSKLAVLELCGWIEVSMDDVVLRGCYRGVKNSNYRKRIEDKVHSNYGFEYKKHFTSMLITLIGVKGLEQIEKTIPSRVMSTFKSELGNLKILRNTFAHTYSYRGMTATYDAPSTTISRYERVANGLSAYDLALRSYC